MMLHRIESSIPRVTAAVGACILDPLVPTSAPVARASMDGYWNRKERIRRHTSAPRACFVGEGRLHFSHHPQNGIALRLQDEAPKARHFADTVLKYCPQIRG